MPERQSLLPSRHNYGTFSIQHRPPKSSDLESQNLKHRTGSPSGTARPSPPRELVVAVALACFTLWALTKLAPPVALSPRLEPEGEPRRAFNLYDTPGEAFRSEADSAVHRSVIAVGVTRGLDRLHAAGYSVVYINRGAAAAARLFRAGYASVLVEDLRALPFADLAADVVVVGGDFADQAASADRRAEIVRLLAVAGTLVVDETSQSGKNWSALLTNESPLLESGTTKFRNVFRRADPRGTGVPACADCGLCSPFDTHSAGLCARGLGNAPRSGSGLCQPRVQADYVSLEDPRRQRAILKEKSLSQGRLKQWPVANVLNTQTTEMWTDRVYGGPNRSWFFSNYVGHDEPDGSRGPVAKLEWQQGDFSSWIASGKVKAVLDAGAGSCTLDYILREEGLAQRLKPYMPFGFYDCSQARICAERGTITLAWNWLNPLPFCSDCYFDLIFQAEGMHHIGQACKEKELLCAGPLWYRTLDNFDAHLSCSGHIYVADHRCKAEEYYKEDGVSFCWRNGTEVWARAKKYRFVEKDAGLLIQKIC